MEKYFVSKRKLTVFIERVWGDNERVSFNSEIELTEFIESAHSWTRVIYQ